MADIDKTTLWSAIVGGISTILGAGGMFTWLTARRTKDSDDRTVHETSVATANQILITNLTTRLLAVEKQSDECEDHHRKCMDEHAETKDKVRILEWKFAQLTNKGTG